MDLTDVVDEIRDALGGITGLRIPEWGVQKINPPAALVMPPERIEYGTTYGPTCDRYPDLRVMVLVPNPTTWRAMQQLAPYADGSGAKSVRAAIEDYTFTACDPDAVKVTEAEFDVVSYNEIPYLAAIFRLDITGTS